jgi:hypothetical protein
MDEFRYIPKYFELYELLSPYGYKEEYYKSKEARERGFSLMDEKLLVTIDVIRGEIVKEPLICNTWYMDGNRKFCGYRELNCTVGSENSQHKLGKAVDLVCYKYTAEEMRQMIIEKQDLLPYPIRIEKDVNWLHIDTKDMNYKGKKIYLFKG